jgi:hypothetical protein
MSYYTALTTAWNGATQPPTGVSGTAITGAMTTAQKVAAVGTWTVTGSIPTVLNVTGSQLWNCVNWTEFAALTTGQQTQILALCALPGPLLGGSSNAGLGTDGMILAYFTNHSGPTVTNLTALAQATAQPWWQYAGMNGAVTAADAQIAGLT